MTDVPNGWKLVPMRPTEEMIRAAIEVINNRKAYGTKGHTFGQMLAEEYIAMVHAAPVLAGIAPSPITGLGPKEGEQA